MYGPVRTIVHTMDTGAAGVSREGIIVNESSLTSRNSVRPARARGRKFVMLTNATL